MFHSLEKFCLPPWKSCVPTLAKFCHYPWKTVVHSLEIYCFTPWKIFDIFFDRSKGSPGLPKLHNK